jgi:hypothetical protein
MNENQPRVDVILKQKRQVVSNPPSLLEISEKPSPLLAHA